MNIRSLARKKASSLLKNTLQSRGTQLAQGIVTDALASDKTQGALQKTRNILKDVNTLSNYYQIGKDLYENIMGLNNYNKPNDNTLNSKNFTLFVPNSAMPSNFKIWQRSTLEDIFMTKVGSSFEVMRVRVVDGSASSLETNLFLLVNPSSLQFNMEKSFSDFITRKGPHFETWGNKPIELSLEGTSGGFYSPYVKGGKINSGIDSGNFMETLSFKNIMALVSMFKNNGFSYTQSNVSKETKKTFPSAKVKDVKAVNMVELAYRDTVFWGSFGSMSLSFSSSTPGKLTYSFTFTAYRHEVL